VVGVPDLDYNGGEYQAESLTFGYVDLGLIQ